MTIEVGTGDSRTRFVKTDWPVVEGNTLGTTKIDGQQANLVAEEGSNVLHDDRVGL